MADNDTELNDGGALAPPPPATEESQALPAPDANASLDGSPAAGESAAGSVVRVDFQAGVRVPAEAGAPPPPAPPKKRATARTKGDGGSEEGAGDTAEKPVQGRKKEKTIDWGKFNHLVENFALLYGTDTVWDDSERMIMKISNMGHAHGSQLVAMWKASEKRRTIRADELVFDPTMKCDTDRVINMYEGMAMVPKKGNVQPMLDLIKFLVSRATSDETETGLVMEWLIRWLAYPLQHPGAKMRSSVVMHGDEGAGKNFLFETVVQIYGKYASIVGQDELEDKFNDWRSCKQFVVGDEIMSRSELVHNKNRLKALITSPTVQINSKHQIRREEKNHMNIVFLSNETQPLALDNTDRRYLVVYTPKAKEDQYYIDLGEWRDNGGVEAFYEYLLTYPLDGFSPYTKPPMTEAKGNLIGLNRKSPERFWAEWSDGELDLPYRSCSRSQAYRAYIKWCQRTGERFPDNETKFSSTLTRFSDTMNSPARIKVMNVAQPGAARKSHRMLLVAEPVLGEGQSKMTEGAWATKAVESFEGELRKYLGYGAGSPAPDSAAAEGNE
jgi:hypothetical protein